MPGVAGDQAVIIGQDDEEEADADAEGDQLFGDAGCRTPVSIDLVALTRLMRPMARSARPFRIRYQSRW